MSKRTIGEVADLVGVDLETLRYYERIGLMKSPPRTKGGHRNYQDADIRRLRFIRRARDVGFSIEDVRTLIAFSRAENKPCGNVLELALSNLEKIRAKRKQLEQMEQVLSQAASSCSGGDAAFCSILAFLDGEAEAGAAAR
ncbi:MAG: MerR family transcriptional regulator [Pseudolabrys sp.]|nr:MerR family transcriptional regulator [Pseudolabrys sp.]